MRFPSKSFICALLCVSPSAGAQTIYPIDRAEILAGARFDLKVEIPVAAGNEIALTINGKDAATITGAQSELVHNEEGQDHTALWLRNASITEPGRYEVVAKTASTTTTVTWDVYGTPRRTARNVILFIGDGMSVAHRTAARILSKGIKEGKYASELAMDDMPHMALVSTAGMDSVITDSANSMSAYTTGHKSCVNAIGVYCARNLNPLAHPRVEIDRNTRSASPEHGGRRGNELRNLGCDACGRNGTYAPSLGDGFDRPHALRCKTRRHTRGRLGLFSSPRSWKQAQRQSRLHHPVQERRLRVCRHGCDAQGHRSR